MSEQFMRLRKEYLRQTLTEDSLTKSPIDQFEHWFKEAIDAQVAHPDAMTLATTTADGTPDARIVLLKGIDANGLRFFTNYLSAKGRQLSSNDSAALLFFWPDLERQVRIKGTVKKASPSESDSYFSSRPRGAQIASSVSPQSEVVPGRDWLEDNLYKAEVAVADGEVIRPPHWGGYILVPHEFEFWQGRENRLHDRLRYRRERDDQWSISRLAP